MLCVLLNTNEEGSFRPVNVTESVEVLCETAMDRQKLCKVLFDLLSIQAWIFLTPFPISIVTFRDLRLSAVRCLLLAFVF